MSEPAEDKSNIISPWGFATGEPIVVPSLIEKIERLLERAKAGDVIGIAVACAYKDGCSSCDVEGIVNGFSTLGAVTALQERVRAIVMDD